MAPASPIDSRGTLQIASPPALGVTADQIENALYGTVGPLTVTHTGQLPSTTVCFNLRPDASLSQAVDGIDQSRVDLRLPVTITGSSSDQAFQDSVSSFGILLLIAAFCTRGSSTR